MIIRKSWTKMPTRAQVVMEKIDSDRVVIMNKISTMRIKQPTIDLVFTTEGLIALSGKDTIKVAEGHPNMIESVVYKLDVFAS